MNTIDIYKLRANNPEITDFYIGSSVSARDRFYQHKTNCNKIEYTSYLYTFIRANGGIDNWTCELLAQCERHLQRQTEQEWIDKLKPTLNKRRAYTDKEQAKEVRKKYDAENAEIIAHKKKEWRQTHDVKEREKQQAKEWRENNPEKRLELQREWTEKNRDHVNAYRLEQYHKNKDDINTKRREHYEANKEQILERQRELRKLKKEAV
jgi:hypothetical protein